MQDADEIIMSVAARQHGIVARWQLVRAGVPLHVVEQRVKRHRLQRLHRCVYRLAPLAGPREREMAAVLSCGESAVLSHHSTAAVLALLPPFAGDVAVSVPRGHPRQRKGVRVYRVRLTPAEITQSDGVPVTTAARTLLDLAATVTARELEQAVAKALRKELTSEADVMRLLNRHHRRPGTGQLRALLALETPPALARSEAEERCLALVRRAQLPAPVTNLRVSGFEVDFCWPRERLVVEVDGLAWHASRRAIVRDRRRDAVLMAAGLRVMRFTWTDLTDQPEATVARLAQALARSRNA
jgi:very-short-patch-repair endonuclease/predicted transcriptional regulator of viral defense system